MGEVWIVVNNALHFQAIKQGRIYALRYELCDDMERAQDKTDHKPGRAMWDFFSPIAVFASAKTGRSNELVPVAIQMDYKPGRLELTLTQINQDRCFKPRSASLLYTGAYHMMVYKKYAKHNKMKV